jgi:hypothetical protein
MKTIWEAIGEATFRAGETIPAVFGSHVPNVALEKVHMICETYSIWTLYIAPVLLKGRFLDERYYNHFFTLFPPPPPPPPPSRGLHIRPRQLGKGRLITR